MDDDLTNFETWLKDNGTKIGNISITFFFIGFLKILYTKFVHIPDQYIGWYFSAVKKSNSIIDSGLIPDIIFSSAKAFLNSSHLFAKSARSFDNIKSPLLLSKHIIQVSIFVIILIYSYII